MVSRRRSAGLFLEIAVNKNPVRRDGHRRGLVQPDVAVNARAFVKPAFELAVASTRTAMMFLPPKCTTSVMSSRNG